MGRYLIDNNVISNYFSEGFSSNGMRFIADIIDSTPYISVITEIEALSWVNPDKAKEKIVHEFVQDSNVIMLSPAIVTKCVAIRRNRKIKTPDAIVAATAISQGMILITSDGDYKGIQGLEVLDPFDL